MNRTSLTNSNKLHTYIQLLIVLIAASGGVAVSLIWFIHDGINYQEKVNLQLSLNKLNTKNIFTWGSSDDPMPLYLIILHWYNDIIGHASLFWDRILSLAAYIGSVFIAYLLGRRASNNKGSVGVIAAIFIAISPFMIWYASRATVYSLLVLVVELNQLFFIAIFHHKKWSLPLYLLTCLVGLALHFFFLAIIIPELVFLIIKHNILKHYEFWLALSIIVISFMAFVVWFIYSSHAINYWHLLPNTSKPSATNTFIIYFQYLFGFQSVKIMTSIISLWPLLVVLGLLAVQKYIQPPTGIKYLFINAILPILLLFLLAWVWQPLFLSSYLIVCLPSFLIFLSWYLTSYKLKTLTIAKYSLVATMLIMVIFEVTNWHLALKQDYLGTIIDQPNVALVSKKL